MGKITRTAEAEAWLRDIYDYIAQDNAVAATHVVDGIYEKAQILGEFPRIGHRCGTKALLSFVKEVAVALSSGSLHGHETPLSPDDHRSSPTGTKAFSIATLASGA